MLKVAELLVSKEECDSRAEFWVEKAAKLLPGNPAVFNLKVRSPKRRFNSSNNNSQNVNIREVKLIMVEGMPH